MKNRVKEFFERAEKPEMEHDTHFEKGFQKTCDLCHAESVAEVHELFLPMPECNCGEC